MSEQIEKVDDSQLPPKIQKPGFVGIPAGPDVCIMDGSNKILNKGEVGEVCIKGDNVTLGYENNSEANKKSFCII